MFILGKALWLVAQPLSLAFILKLLAFILALRRRFRLAFAAGLLAILILFVTLFTSFGAWSLQILEARHPRPSQPPEGLNCIVVLGGAFDLEVTAGRGGMEMNQSADRFIEAARLARLNGDARILISGGDGSFSGTYRGDSELAGAFFAAMGIDPARLIRETASRNTAENASQTAAILKREKLDHCLLITSAYHMPRALALFESAGIELDPWPSDYRASGRVALGFDFTQPTLNSQLTSTAVREWLALMRTYLSGQSSALLP